MNYRQTIIKNNIQKARKYYNHLTEKERGKVESIQAMREVSFHDFNELQDINQKLEIRR